MRFNKVKWVTLAIAYCFAVLQVLQPFIHAHLDAEHPIQESGFHIGSEHEEHADFFDQVINHAVSNADHISHTISVASGIKENFKPTLLADIFCVIVLCLCFAIVLLSTVRPYRPLTLTPYQSLKRRLPASRAPPQF